MQVALAPWFPLVPLPTPPAHAPYARVKQHLKQGLASGRWPPGALMPSEAELVAEFGVSRMTVNRAMRELQADGLVARSQGVGTFAAPLHRVSSTLTIRDLQEEIEARGHRHHAEVHLQRAEPRPAALAAQLGVEPGRQVFHTLIVHFENGVPLQCEDRYVNPACAPDYLAGRLHAHHADARTCSRPRRCGARSTRSRLRGPPRRRHACCSIGADEPCLIVVRRTFTRDAAITIARLVHPARYASGARPEPRRRIATTRPQAEVPPYAHARVRLADCPPQPWRNGGGVTRELLAWPQAADWRLRVSVADIERDGPFSPFPGVDRWFAVIEGDGVELRCRTGASRAAAPATRRCASTARPRRPAACCTGRRATSTSWCAEARAWLHAQRPRRRAASRAARLVRDSMSPTWHWSTSTSTPSRCPPGTLLWSDGGASPGRGTCALPAAPGG